MIRQYPIINQVLEFRVDDGSAGTFLVTRGNIRNAMFLCTSSGNGRVLAGSIKVNLVQIWSYGSDAVPGIPFSISAEWSGTSNPNNTVRAYGNSDNPAFLALPPAPDTVVGNWGNAGDDATSILTMTLNDRDLLRIHVSWVMEDSVTNGAVSAATALTGPASTAGVLYFNALKTGIPSTSLASSGSTPFT